MLLVQGKTPVIHIYSQDVVHVTPCDSMWPAMYSKLFQFLLTNATAIFSSVTGQENVQLATHTYYMHDQISTTTDQTWYQVFCHQLCIN